VIDIYYFEDFSIADVRKES